MWRLRLRRLRLRLWIGLYYHYTPPVLGDPVDPPPPRPIRPAHKYKSEHALVTTDCGRPMQGLMMIEKECDDSWQQHLSYAGYG